MTPRNRTPDISYIVSAYNRPEMLLVILAALNIQTNPRFEVIITDNSEDAITIARHREIVYFFNDKRFRYVNTAKKVKVSDCYWSAEYGVKLAKGEFLCFPCDDTYVVPEFGRRMLLAAHENNWDMVICGDVIVGPECNGGIGYKPWKMLPRKASKTTFIVRASAFPGFTGKLHTQGAVLADYHLSGQIHKCGVINEQYMVVHL